MLGYARRWMPYGGGSSEDIMVTFGLVTETYFLRLRTMLTAPIRLDNLDAGTTAALLSICQLRLKQSPPPGSIADRR
ncbi:hypothetical protein ACNHUS_34680 [Actinomycetes bacterium M1A6_2h]